MARTQEAEENQRLVAHLEEQGFTPDQLKQPKEVLEETLAMVSDSRRRLKAAHAKVGAFLETNTATRKGASREDQELWREARALSAHAGWVPSPDGDPAGQDGSSTINVRNHHDYEPSRGTGGSSETTSGTDGFGGSSFALDHQGRAQQDPGPHTTAPPRESRGTRRRAAGKEAQTGAAASLSSTSASYECGTWVCA